LTKKVKYFLKTPCKEEKDVLQCNCRQNTSSIEELEQTKKEEKEI